MLYYIYQRLATQGYTMTLLDRIHAILSEPINLDFQTIQDDEPELPAHLIPTEQMRQNFINNCKEMGMWE